MPQNSLIKYINEKYTANGSANTPAQSGIIWSQSVNNVHSYYKVITRTNSDDQSIVETIELDPNTWANTGAYNVNYTLQDGSVINETLTKTKKTFYEYEVEENDAKRTINLLRPEFVPAVEKEFKRVIKGKI